MTETPEFDAAAGDHLERVEELLSTHPRTLGQVLAEHPRGEGDGEEEKDESS